MTTLKEFWRGLTPADRDELRKLLASSLFVTTTTVSAYGSGARVVPLAKRDAMKRLISENYQEDIVFLA